MAQPFSFSTYDLDLDMLDECQDLDELPKIFQQLIQADNDFKIMPARSWMENFLYYGGLKEFHTRFSTSTVTGNALNPNLQNRFSTRRRHIPKFFKACQVQAANVTRQRPSIKVWPLSEDEVAEKKAKLANILIDYFWDEDCEDDIYYEAILLSLLTPAVARKDVIDYSFNKTRLWPIEETIVDPYTGKPMTHVKNDVAGNPMMEQLAWYRSELITAFRLIFNPSATWQHDLDFVGDVSIKRMGFLRQNYGMTGEGYHPENLEKIKPGAWSYTPIIGMESAVKQLAFGTTRTYRNFTYGALPVRDGCIVGNFFIRPTPKYPNGREIVVAQGTTLYDGPSRTFREIPKITWHPYSFMTYERVPGRLWGTTYGEKLADLTKAYDQARMEFDQLRKTFSKPKLMMPIGAGLDRDTYVGEEQIFRYNPYAADGGKPAYLNAPQPPTTIVDEIRLIKEEFTEISGITEIMQGIRPQGVTTWRGLEVLREEANNAANNFIRMYENFIQRSQYNKMEIIRKSLTRPDKNLTSALKIFKKMNQYITDIDIQDFIGDDIAGFVKIEPYSTIGKSRLALQAKYESMAQIGVLGDIVNDPDLNQEYKRKMDVQGFDAPRNRQVVFARYENQLMFKADKMKTIINPQVAQWHEHPIHIREIENCLLDPAIESKPFVKQSLVAHRESHMQIMAMLAAEAMASAVNQATQGAPPEQKPGKPAQPGAQPGQPPQAQQKPTPAKQSEGMLFGPENSGFGENSI